MRILYGVQGTGNGHTTRARALLPALQQQNIEVDFLFSGREPNGYFNMEPFGAYETRQGLTLKTQAGSVKLWQTATGNNLWRLYKDIKALDVREYDLVISDFEPVTAWAAKRAGVPSLGIAHQYAFLHSVPGSRRAPWLKHALHMVAPVDQAIGLHWDDFDAPILPPMVERAVMPQTVEPSFVLVYLPFEAIDDIRYWLRQFPEQRFVIYAAVEKEEMIENLHFKTFSRAGFCQDMANSEGVVCNAGFGVCSEAIQAGKKLLVKPLANQIEQRANVDALIALGRGMAMEQFGKQVISEWLHSRSVSPLPWPDTAAALARWIAEGRRQTVAQLSAELWNEVAANAGYRRSVA